MPRSLFVVVVISVGFVAYLMGASFPLRPPASMGSPSGETVSAAEREPAQRRIDTDARIDASLRQVSDSNRALRTSIMELAEELRAARVALAVPAADREASSSGEHWAARLRAREPDVLLDTVCRLRERVLTRALRMDAEAKSAVGPIVGLLDSNDLQAAQRLQTQQATMYRDQADRCRVANSELDALRTLDDLAQWRMRFEEW